MNSLKKLLPSLFRGFVLFLVILMIYYLAILKPSLKEPNEKLEVYKNIANVRSVAVQNKIAVESVVALDPNSPQYQYSLGQIYTQISRSLEELSTLKDAGSRLPGYPKAAEDLNLELMETLSENEKGVQELKEFDQKYGKIFEYFPQSEFGELEPAVDSEEIKKRIENAKGALAALDKTQSKSEIKLSLEALDRLSSAKNQAEFEKSLEELDKIFQSLKQALFDEKINVYKNSGQDKALAKESDLIKNYGEILENYFK